MTDALLARIADALDRLAPPPPASADPLAHPAYVWRDGALVAARDFAPLSLALLHGIDAQKATLLENLRRLARGLPAHDALLWGARGSGKSALVKACVGQVQAEDGALALVEAAGDALDRLPGLFARLAAEPRGFVVFVDDLGFGDAGGGGGGGEGPRRLRSLLEGGAEARPGNVRLIVTANRRHIVPRDIAEQSVAASRALPGASLSSGAGSYGEPGAINARDVVDDKLALADRFGLSLGFHVADQAAYLAMVAGYARAYGLAFEQQDALAWATARGSRSGRVAWQYVVELAGRQQRRIDR